MDKTRAQRPELPRPWTYFGSSVCFPHKDFIASSRIVFSMKRSTTEDVCINLLARKLRWKNKQLLDQTLQSYLFLVTKPSFGDKVVHLRLFRFSRCLWMITFPYLTSNCFYRVSITSRENLKSFPFSKCSFQLCALRCPWKYVMCCGFVQ